MDNNTKNDNPTFLAYPEEIERLKEERPVETETFGERAFMFFGGKVCLAQQIEETRDSFYLRNSIHTDVKGPGGATIVMEMFPSRVQRVLKTSLISVSLMTLQQRRLYFTTLRSNPEKFGLSDDQLKEVTEFLDCYSAKEVEYSPSSFDVNTPYYESKMKH